MLQGDFDTLGRRQQNLLGSAAELLRSSKRLKTHPLETKISREYFNSRKRKGD